MKYTRYPNSYTPDVQPDRPARRGSGKALPWIIFALVLLSLIGLLVLWGPKRNGARLAAIQEPTPADVQAVQEKLTELGDFLGQVLEHKREVQPLIDQIEAFIKDHPDMAEAHTLHGQALLSAGRMAEALAALERSLEIEPRQANIHQLAGTLAMGLKQYESALHHYEQALSIEPDNAEYAVYLANVEFRLGQNDQAVLTLLTALRHDSKLHPAYALLSDIYASQNKLGMALDQIGRAIEMVPADNGAMRVVYTLKEASLLRRDNKPAEALATLQSLPAEFRLRPEVLRDTATCWAMLGKPEVAADMYEQVLLLDPSNDTAAAEAARWWLKADDIEAARRNVNTLRRINPRSEALLDLDQILQNNQTTP